MVRYGKSSKLDANQVLEKAMRFFGPAGLGLEVEEATSACIRWTGGGGFVYLSVCEGLKGSEITLEAREWEQYAKEFVARL